MRKPIRPFVVEVKGSKRASKLDDFWKLADQPAAVPADKAMQTANSLFKKAPDEQSALAAAEAHGGRAGAPARSGRILMDLAYKEPVEPVPAETERPASDPLAAFDPPLKRRPGRPRKIVTEQDATAPSRAVAAPTARSRPSRQDAAGAPKGKEIGMPRGVAGRPAAKTMAMWMLEPDEPPAPVAKPARAIVQPAADDETDQGRARRVAVPSRAEKWKRRLPKVLR